MLPIAAQFARRATEALAHSALPEAPVSHVSERARTPAPGRGHRLAAAIANWRTSGARADARRSPIEQPR